MRGMGNCAGEIGLPITFEWINILIGSDVAQSDPLHHADRSYPEPDDVVSASVLTRAAEAAVSSSVAGTGSRLRRKTLSLSERRRNRVIQT